MAEFRAASFTKRSIKAASKRAAIELAMSMVDLTTLEGKDTPEKVRSLCRKAVDPSDGTMPGVPPVAAVCVYPQMVAFVRKELDQLALHNPAAKSVKIAAVATGFPSGQYPLKVRLDDTRRAVDAGADEIDMVISRGAYLAGNHRQVYDEICATVEACGFASATSDERRVAGKRTPAAARRVSAPSLDFAHLKVILETGELETLDNARHASDIAISALADTGMASIPGAAFIKTSTGKVEPAATMPVTLVMLEAIRDHFFATGQYIGMKPAGGIRASKAAIHYLVMLQETLGGIAGPDGQPGIYLTPELFRFGASALVNDLTRQLRWLDTGRYAARYDFAEA
jgi:deoxyribose-phosphate aldolase